MNETEAQKELRGINKVSVEVWRWLVGLLLGGMIATVLGQFTPNRKIVTSDQLEPLTNAITEQTREISDLKVQVSEMRGELQAEKFISKTP